MKFCFLCGKQTNKLIEGYCQNCYNKKFSLIKVPEKIEVTICSKCNSVKDGDKWKDVNLEDFIKNKIKILGKKVEIDIEVNHSVKLRVKGYLENTKKLKKEFYEIPLKTKKITCRICSRQSGNYYEGIIQLRGDITQEVIDSIDDCVTEEIFNDKRVFYKAKKVKVGLDLYMSDKYITKRISDLLKKKYKAKVKKTYKLITKKEGKDIYKATVLVKI